MLFRSEGAILGLLGGLGRGLANECDDELTRSPAWRALMEDMAATLSLRRGGFWRGSSCPIWEGGAHVATQEGMARPLKSASRSRWEPLGA